MKKGMVVYGFPAIGKTTVCKKFDNFIDLESSDYQWLFTDEQKNMSAEERKGGDKVKNPEWPQNYYDAIEEARKNYDYVFVAYAGIEYCLKNNLPYMRVFPTLDQKEDYLNRMRARGNNESFVSKMSDNFENFVNSCKADEKSINYETKKGEFLEDCFKRVGLINENEDYME